MENYLAVSRKSIIFAVVKEFFEVVVVGCTAK